MDPIWRSARAVTRAELTMIGGAKRFVGCDRRGWNYWLSGCEILAIKMDATSGKIEHRANKEATNLQKMQIATSDKPVVAVKLDAKQTRRDG